MADYAREIACDCPPKFSLLQGSLQAEVDAHIQASEAAACRQTGGCMEWWISSCDVLCFMIVCIRGCSSAKECLIYTSGKFSTSQKTHFYCITGLVDKRGGSTRGILWRPHSLFQNIMTIE